MLHDHPVAKPRAPSPEHPPIEDIEVDPRGMLLDPVPHLAKVPAKAKTSPAATPAKPSSSASSGGLPAKKAGPPPKHIVPPPGSESDDGEIHLFPPERKSAPAPPPAKAKAKAKAKGVGRGPRGDPRPFIPAIGGGEVFFEDYVPGEGRRGYANWIFRCPHHHGCQRTMGMGPRNTTPHGELQPLAYLHIWRDTPVDPAKRNHRTADIPPARFHEVPTFLEEHRDELQALLDHFTAP